MTQPANPATAADCAISPETAVRVLPADRTKLYPTDKHLMVPPAVFGIRLLDLSVVPAKYALRVTALGSCPLAVLYDDGTWLMEIPARLNDVAVLSTALFRKAQGSSTRWTVEA